MEPYFGLYNDPLKNIETCLQVFKSKLPLRIGYYIDGVCRASPSCKRAVLMAKQRLESLGHQVKTTIH